MTSARRGGSNIADTTPKNLRTPFVNVLKPSKTVKIRFWPHIQEKKQAILEKNSMGTPSNKG